MAESADRRSCLLRAEHERALSLLHREKSAAVAIEAAAAEKCRRVEVAMSSIADSEEQLKRRVALAEEQVRTHTQAPISATAN